MGRQLHIPSVIFLRDASNSDEGNKFTGEKFQQKNLNYSLGKIVSKFIRHENRSSSRLNTYHLCLAASASFQVWKQMSFFKSKLERNLRTKCWQSNVLTSLTSSHSVSLVQLPLWFRNFVSDSLKNYSCYTNFAPIRSVGHVYYLFWF